MYDTGVPHTNLSIISEHTLHTTLKYIYNELITKHDTPPKCVANVSALWYCITIQRKVYKMFRTEEQTLAVAHLWAIEIPYEGVQNYYGLFATQELAQAFIDADEYLEGHAIPMPMALPTV